MRNHNYAFTLFSIAFAGLSACESQSVVDAVAPVNEISAKLEIDRAIAVPQENGTSNEGRLVGTISYLLEEIDSDRYRADMNMNLGIRTDTERPSKEYPSEDETYLEDTAYEISKQYPWEVKAIFSGEASQASTFEGRFAIFGAAPGHELQLEFSVSKTNTGFAQLHLIGAEIKVAD